MISTGWSAQEMVDDPLRSTGIGAGAIVWRLAPLVAVELTEEDSRLYLLDFRPVPSADSLYINLRGGRGPRGRECPDELRSANQMLGRAPRGERQRSSFQGRIRSKATH